MEEQLKRDKALERERIVSQGRAFPVPPMQGQVTDKDDPNTIEYERELQIIATRGVVRLFNALQTEQTEMKQKFKEVEVAK